MIDRSITAEAVDLVTGDRNASYGSASDNLGRTARLWSAMFGWDCTASDVALAMVLVKLARHSHTRRRDNRVDIVGYLLLEDEISQAERPSDTAH